MHLKARKFHAVHTAGVVLISRARVLRKHLRKGLALFTGHLFPKARGILYRKVMPAKGWNTYDTISVKWSHQVVATRRYIQQRAEDTYDPDDDEPAPDMEMMTDAAAPAASAAPKEESHVEKKTEPKKTEAKPKEKDKAKSKSKPADQAKKAAKPDKAKVKKDAGKKKSK